MERKLITPSKPNFQHDERQALNLEWLAFSKELIRNHP
jgi:hypothetical protein